MLTSLVLGAAIAAPSAPLPRDTNPAPTGPAPWSLYLKADAGGRVMVRVTRMQKVTQARQVIEVVGGKQVAKLIQEQVERPTTSYITLDQQATKFATAAGTPVAAAAVMAKAKDGVAVLVSADGKPVDRAWLRGVNPDAVVVTAEALVGTMAPQPTVVVPTLAPRLVMLGTGKGGKVQVAYNPGGAGVNGNVMLGARANRVVFINNGNGQMPVFLNEDGSYGPTTPATGEAPVKPLADVPFDAYDLTGKLVKRADALARLTAGGLVLVAGDTRVPDEAYLRQYRGDLLVLVSNELVNVPTGVKGKPGVAAPGPVKPVAVPAIQAVPLLRVQPALVKPAVLKVAPVQRAVPAPAEEKAPAAPVEKSKG